MILFTLLSGRHRVANATAVVIVDVVVIVAIAITVAARAIDVGRPGLDSPRARGSPQRRQREPAMAFAPLA